MSYKSEHDQYDDKKLFVAGSWGIVMPLGNGMQEVYGGSWIGMERVEEYRYQEKDPTAHLFKDNGKPINASITNCLL